MGKAIIFASDNHATNNQKNEHMKMRTLLLVILATLGLTASTMAQNLPNYVPVNGLVGWWPFNGNANDESGNGNNGTVNGATLTQDRFGNTNEAFQFNQGHYIEIQNLFQNNINQYTISAWFKKDPSNSNNDGAIVSGSAAQAPAGIRLNIGAINRFQFQVEGSTGNGNNGVLQLAPGDNNNYCDNIWHLVTGTFNSPNGLISSSSFKIYVDGNLVQTISNNTNWPTWDTTTYAPVNNGTRNIIIGNSGGNLFNFSNSFLGILDDIGIWNRALTQQEISDLYNSINCSNNTTITPETNALATGSTATFSVTTSDPNPSYLWQSDFGQGYVTLNDIGNYSGTNTNILSISNVQLANHNVPIRVISTSGECIDTSEVATISILDTCITLINDTTFITVTDTLLINTLITGINPPNISNTIKIYPNPANSQITIEYGDFEIMNGYQLRIENSLGQEVFQTSITQQTDYLSLSNWGGNGLYFVHIIDPQGNTIDIRKIVLQ
jgi:hypothetical protein